MLLKTNKGILWYERTVVTYLLTCYLFNITVNRRKYMQNLTMQGNAKRKRKTSEF